MLQLHGQKFNNLDDAVDFTYDRMLYGLEKFGWRQGSYGSSYAAKCGEGALRWAVTGCTTATKFNADAYAVHARATQRLLMEMPPINHMFRHNSIISYNDMPERTKDDMLDVIRKAKANRPEPVTLSEHATMHQLLVAHLAEYPPLPPELVTMAKMPILLTFSQWKSNQAEKLKELVSV